MLIFLKRIAGVMKAYLLLEILGFVLILLYSLAVFVSPIVSKYLIDEIIPSDSVKTLNIGLAAFFIACAAQPAIGYFKDLLFVNISEKIALNIRLKLFYKIINAPIEFYDSRKKGDILSRILNDGRNISDFINKFFIEFLKDIIMIIMIIIGMLLFSMKITIIVLTIFTAFIFVNYILSRKLNKISAEIQKNVDSICTSINQATDSIMIIKTFLMEDRTCDNFEAVLKKNYKDNIKALSLGVLLNNATNLVSIFSLCVIYGLGTLSVMNDSMSLGSVIGLGLYFQLLVQPVFGVVNSNVGLQMMLPVFERTFEFLNLKTEDSIKERLDNISGDIDVKGLCFTYPNGVEVLKDVNMHIGKNSLTVITGISGTGKSTFVKLLLGLYSKSAGEIFIDGIEIEEIGVKNLRRNIAYVSQDIELYNMSIKENIKCGRTEVSDEELLSLCKKLRIHDKIMELPNGYDSILNERANLSGGEKQRIAIARALLKKPSIIILDEPTSALDYNNEANIKDMIENLAKNYTVILIAHKFSEMVDADNIFVFKNDYTVEQKSERN